MGRSSLQSEANQQLVLLIDDSADVHRLLQSRLRGDEITIEGAMTGREGIRLARELAPAMIIVDLDLPDMDGFEILRALKDDASTMHTPVMILSAMTSRQDKVTAFDLGAIDFVCKPFDLVELRVRVRSAVRLSVLLQMLSQRAQIDGLTGLYNRAHFDSRWGEEVAGCMRHNRPLSLAVLDADKFKTINDTYGHPAGDAVLRGISRVLQGELRGADIACRFGGEEFCIIMPDTDTREAHAVCERIREAVGSTVWAAHPERRVTISVGLVGTDGTCWKSPAAWLDAADRNLYRAKQEGRDRVVSSDLSGGDLSERDLSKAA